MSVSENNTAPNFVVLAEFTVLPGKRDAFLAFAHEDARQSLANEPGCLVFDVLVTDSTPEVVVLHEVYRDAAAFDHHKTMPHYAPFKEGTGPLLDGAPSVRLFRSTQPATVSGVGARTE